MTDEFKIIPNKNKNILNFNGNGFGEQPEFYQEEITIDNPKSISEVTRKLMRKERIRKEFFSKIYKPTKTHYCPNECSTTIFGVIAGQNTTVNQEVCRKVHSERKKYNFPTYFVEQDLLKMIQMTQIKKSLSLDDLNWPINSMFFVFPKKHYLAGTHKENPIYAQGVYVSRSFDVQTLEWQLTAKQKGLNASDYRMYDKDLCDDFTNILDTENFNQAKYDKAKKKWEKVYGDGITIIESLAMAVPLSDGSMCTMSYPISGNDFLTTLKIYKSIYTYEDPEGNVTTEDAYKKSPDDYTLMGKLPDGSLIEDETTMMQDIALNAMKLIVYMASRKAEWTKKETTCGVVKGRRFGKSKLWTPNYLGKKYSGYISSQNKRSEETSSKKLKFHWRLGYQGVRWHGKGRTQKKLVWVLPYKVNEENK